MSRCVLLNPKLTSLSISVIFKQKNISPYSKFFQEKSSSNLPWLFNFAKILSKYVSRIKTKSHKVLSMIGP